MPISVGNGQQIAPNVPKLRSKPRAKPKTQYQRGATSFSNALGVGETATQAPLTRQRREARQRVKRAAQALPGKPSLREVDRAHEGALVDVFEAQPRSTRDEIVFNAIGRRSINGDVILKHVFGASGDELERKLNALRSVPAFRAGVPRSATGGAGAGSIDWLRSFGSSIYNNLRQPGDGLQVQPGDHSPFEATPLGRKVFKTAGDVVGAPSSKQLERALSDPKSFLASPEATRNPALAQTATTQKTLTDLSGFLDRAIDAGQQRGILNDGRGTTAGFDGGRIGVNALHDLANLPAQAIPSTYLPISQAAEGDTAGAARSLAQPYVDLAKDPKRAFTEHPLNSALMVYGPLSGASRTAGSAGRKLGIEAASTERAPLRVPGTELEVSRSYRPGLVAKGAQVALEARRGGKAANLRREAGRLETQARRNPEMLAEFQQAAAGKRQAAARLAPNRMSDNQVQKLVDELEGNNQALQSKHRDEVVGVPRLVLKDKQGQRAGHAISPIAQGIVKPTVESVRSYRDSLAEIDATGILSPAERSANLALRRGLSRALRQADKGKLDFVKVQELIDRHYRPLMERLEAKLDEASILPRDQAERAKLIPFAAKEMREPIGEIGAASNARIRQRMQEEGYADPVFIAQAPNRRGSGNFYRHWSNPGTIGRASRSGRATIKGTYDAHPETLVEQVARMQGLVDTHEGFGRFVDRFGLRARGEVVRFQSREAATRAAGDLQHLADGREWQVVQLSPWKGRTSQAAELIDGAVPDGDVPQSVAQVLSAALDGQGEGPFVLVPRAAANRLRDHVNVLSQGGGGKVFRLFSSSFRRAVLATSPTWAAGNVIEGGLRAAINRATPMDARFASKVFRRMDELEPGAGEQALMAAQPGGHYGMAGGAPRTAADQFKDASAPVAGLARAAGAFWKAPGPKHLAGVWRHWTDFVFGRMNGALELPAQRAMAGRAMRKRFDLGARALLNMDTAVDQAARGLMGTPEQVRMGREIRDAYGQYASFSPAQRRVLALYTPFAAWTLNAVKFLYHVLPRDHPVLVALLADANIASEQWRREHGLDLFMGRGSLPGFLQGSIPTGRGGHLRIGRFTPFSFASDPTETVASLLLPQLSGPANALRGQDWTGKPLRNRDGTPYDPLQLAGEAVRQLVESTVPLAGKADQFSNYDGSLGSRVNRLVNPFVITPGSRRRGASGSGPVVRVPRVTVPTIRVPVVTVR